MSQLFFWHRKTFFSMYEVQSAQGHAFSLSACPPTTMIFHDFRVEILQFRLLHQLLCFSNYPLSHKLISRLSHFKNNVLIMNQFMNQLTTSSSSRQTGEEFNVSHYKSAMDSKDNQVFKTNFFFVLAIKTNTV